MPRGAMEEPRQVGIECTCARVFRLVRHRYPRPNAGMVQNNARFVLAAGIGGARNRRVPEWQLYAVRHRQSHEVYKQAVVQGR